MEDRYRHGGSLHLSSDRLFAAHKGNMPYHAAPGVLSAGIRWLLEVDRLIVALALFIPVACISFFPDGSQAPRWALISLTPLIALRAKVLLPWPAVAVILYLAVSITWSPDPFSGADLAWHFSVLIVVALIAPVNMNPVYWAIGLGLAINSVVVMLQIDGWNPVTTVGVASPGLFFNRNQSNDFIAYTLAIFIAIPLATVPLERAPIIALAAAGLFLIVRRWLILIPSSIVLIGGLVFFLIADGERMASLTSRIQTWTEAIEGLTLFGNGLGSFQWEWPQMERAHNDLLQIAYELGLPGFLVAAAFMLYCLAWGPVVPRLILIVFAVEGLFDFPLYQPATGFLAALAAGHLLRHRGPLLRPLTDSEWIRFVRQKPY
jgi:hypothetical protein